MRTFDAVVRHGTVTEAANALDLAPSSVSEQIRALEKSLEVSLFARTPKGMRLTEAGGRMLEWARRLLAQAEQARREVRGARPVLRLGALETIAATYVPRVLNRLAERRPDLEVEVRSERGRDGLFDDVAAGRLEAALLLDAGDGIGDLGFPAPPEPFAFVDLEPVPLVVVAAPGHRLDGKPSLSAGDLRGERLLVNVPACSFWIAGERILGPDLQRIKAGGVSVMRAWVEQGLGISLLPEFAVSEGLDSGSLVRLDIPLPDLSLRLVWRDDQQALPGLQDVLYAAAHP